MGIDFNKYGKSSLSASTSTPSISATPPVVPISNVTTVNKGVIDLNKFGKKGSYTPTVPPVKPIVASEKGLFGTIASGMLKLPARAATNLTQAGQIAMGEKPTEPFSGPFLGQVKSIGTEGTFGEKLKDTAGASIEAASYIPLFKSAGITWDILKGSLKAGGFQALKTAAIPLAKEGAISGGMSSLGMGLQEDKDAKDLAVDTAFGTVMGGVAAPIVGAGTAVAGKVLRTTIPALEKRYIAQESKSLFKPTTIPKKGFEDATDIYEKSIADGNKIDQAMLNKNILTKDIVDGNTYSTKSAYKKVREDAIAESNKTMRPALKEAEGDVQRVPVSEVEARLKAEVNSIPPSKISDLNRAKRLAEIEAEYGVKSEAAKKHPYGYSLTDIHDSKIEASARAKYGVDGTTPDILSAQKARNEGTVFMKLLEEKAPPELNIGEFNRKIQEQFQLADYLESLHGKTIPPSIVRRIADQFTKMAGGAIGASSSGVPGAIVGYNIAGGMTKVFDRFSNPVKTLILRNLKKESPEIFKQFEKYYGKAVVDRMERLGLPPSSAVNKGLFKLQNEVGAIPIPERIPAPTSAEQKMANDFLQNMRTVGNTKLLPPGTPPIITPNLQGTPNPRIGQFYGKGGDVGGMSQKLNAYPPKTPSSVPAKKNPVSINPKTGKLQTSYNSSKK